MRELNLRGKSRERVLFILSASNVVAEQNTLQEHEQRQRGEEKEEANSTRSNEGRKGERGGGGGDAGVI